jgi:hypothetical protein
VFKFKGLDEEAGGDVEKAAGGGEGGEGVEMGDEDEL